MNPNSALAQAESLLLAPYSLAEGDLARTFGLDRHAEQTQPEAPDLDSGSGGFHQWAEKLRRGCSLRTRRVCPSHPRMQSVLARTVYRN